MAKNLDISDKMLASKQASKQVDHYPPGTIGGIAGRETPCWASAEAQARQGVLFWGPLGSPSLGMNHHV